MKKQLLFFFLALFLINSVLALDCQYTKNESYEVEEEWFYFDEEFEGANLNVNELVSFENNHLSFIVYNNLTIPIKVELNYTLRSEWFGINTPTSIQLEVEPRSSETHQEERISSGGSWASKYWIEKFEPTILEPKITSEWKIVTKQKEICKLCDNEVCLNDGSQCNSLYDDSKCGSGICNIAGFCGSQKVVDCPNGRLNCQDKICLESSTKEEGESYMCSFECKSDRFENGTCLKSSLVLQQEEDKRNKNFIIFGVLVLIILSAGVGYFAFFKRKKEEKLKNQILEEKNSLLDEIDNLKKDKENLQSSIKSLNSEIENMNLLINKGKDKISSLKKEIKDTEGKAKEELEKRLRFEEQRQKDRISKLEKQREKLENEEEKIITIEKDLGSKKLKFEKENKEFFIKKALDKYKQRYPNIFYDEETGYIKFSSQGNEPLHRYLYKKFDKNLSGKEVHHIDADKLNNENSNLISIPYEKHKKLNHLLIDFKDWESGIRQLREQLEMEDSDFPEHIQKEIEKRRQQKRLSVYARKSRRKR
ncbi:MAG: hypothetical protein KKC19_03220 [Nanoarchaeota archaeon]|nr:hypothetical protein [Nanoarchaeota archaeon]